MSEGNRVNVAGFVAVPEDTDMEDRDEVGEAVRKELDEGNFALDGFEVVEK